MKLLKKFGSWFIIAGLVLLVVVVTICSGIRNDLEEQKRNELREKALQGEKE